MTEDRQPGDDRENDDGGSQPKVAEPSVTFSALGCRATINLRIPPSG